MKIFVTGTDTNVGKTLISAWLCAHLQYDYWKPIQTGERDADFIRSMVPLSSTIYPEKYIFQDAVSPHFAAILNNIKIELNHFQLPSTDKLIIEGAGGVLVPLNEHYLIIDLIKKLNTPVILVSRSGLGTINHTLLSIEALRHRNIPILGVILNQFDPNVAFMAENKRAIEYYGQVAVLACLPLIQDITAQKIKQIVFPDKLREILHHV